MEILIFFVLSDLGFYASWWFKIIILKVVCFIVGCFYGWYFLGSIGLLGQFMSQYQRACTLNAKQEVLLNEIYKVVLKDKNKKEDQFYTSNARKLNEVLTYMKDFVFYEELNELQKR